MSSKEVVDKLNAAVTRLMEENAQTRRKIEEVQVILRRRCPKADGLTLAAAVKTILDDRDAAMSRVFVYREKLKKMLTMISDGKKAKEVAREISQFLFSNSD